MDEQRRSRLLAALGRPEDPQALLALADELERLEPRRASRWRMVAAAQWPDDPALAGAVLAGLVDQHLPYSARALARACPPLANHPAALAIVAETEALFPDPDVTVCVLARDAAASIGEVLLGLVRQTCPVARVVVVDHGSVDSTGPLAEAAGAEVVRVPREATLALARQVGLQACATDYLAYLDADLAPDESWLERLYLHFRRRELLTGATDQGEPLGAVFGTALDDHQASVADLWHARHVMPYFSGRQTVDIAPWLYACNLLCRREALIAAGGWAIARPRAEELILSAALRARGYRIAFDSAARCHRCRRYTLAEALDSAVGYQSAYVWQQSFAQYAGGDLAALLAQLPHTLERCRLERVVDEHFHLDELAYPTFLVLPWLVFADFRLAAAQAQLGAEVALRHTHAALWLAIFPVLASLGADAAFLGQLAEDLRAAAPDDPELAELCSPAGAAAQLDAEASGFNPIDMLTQRDNDVFLAHLRALAGAWDFDEAAWMRLRASQQQAELDRATPLAQRVAVVRLADGGPDQPPADADKLLTELANEGVQPGVFVPLFDLDETFGAVAAFDPSRAVLVVPAGADDAWLEAALVCREHLPDLPIEVVTDTEPPLPDLSAIGISRRRTPQ